MTGERTMLRLGTRRSPLAWAQSGQVAQQIERLVPGLRVERVGIETRGDRLSSTALWRTPGRDFFTGELDEALRSGQVDLTVHSHKDLALDRPEDLALAAIPSREDPRDVIVFHARVTERLSQGLPIRVGTSSPRRLALVPPFLQQALPRLGHSTTVEFSEIRGNLDTRLRRLHAPADDPRRLDGIVVALAGLVRLHSDDTGRAMLEDLLQGVRWMILPLPECPGAPGQGALAVETRAADEWLRRRLSALHDPETQRAVHREREILGEWGGGCHQPLGATGIHHPELGSVLFTAGRTPDGETVRRCEWKATHGSPDPDRPVVAWDGSLHRGSLESPEPGARPAPPPPGTLQNRRIFAAHSRALPSGWDLSEARLWTAGTGSWFRLASRGHWVEGCAEGLGFNAIRSTANRPVLGDHPRPWLVLTHTGAVAPTPDVESWATYSVPALDETQLTQCSEQLARATHLFWGSAEQFRQLQTLVRKVGPGARHACGPGATAQRLREAGLQPDVFPDREHWRRWLNLP
jgi:hydroxymethylbilane synthase